MIHDRLIPALEAETDGALRTVATYSEAGYDLHHLREDVENVYSTEEIDAVYEDLLLDNMNRAYLERLFHAGRLECTVLGFEDAVMLHFSGEVHSGLFVSVDRVPDIEVLSIIETCKDALPA